MKVLFLDIDGVLNRRGTKERCGPWKGVDRQLAKRFTDWIDTTDYNIVLSSTWRTDPTMYDHLHEAGIYWIAQTPEQTRQDKLSRGDEIAEWLKNNPVDEYIILDDMDVLPSQQHRHVQTKEDWGLTEKELNELRSLSKAERDPHVVSEPLSTAVDMLVTR